MIDVSQPYSIKYFQNLPLSSQNSGNMTESTEKILIKFSIKNFKQEAFYQIFIKSRDNSFPNFSTESFEVFNFTTSLNFAKYLICDYFFEKDQLIEITISVKSKNEYDNKIYNFQRNTKLSSLVCEKNCIYQRKIDETPNSVHKEILILSVEKVKNSIQYINISLSCKRNNNINFSDIKSKIRYLIKNKEKKNIYLSEILNDNGIFDNINIPLELLSPMFDIYFLYEQNLVQQKKININEFIDKEKNLKNVFIEIPILSDNPNNNMIKIINNSTLTIKYSLFDYIKSGLKLNIFMAIDMSNKNYINQIKKAIKSCGNILSYYTCTETKEPIFKVYCFGAKFKNSNNIFFNLNLQETPDIIFLKNVTKKYVEFFNSNKDKIELNNNINFFPLIKHVYNEIKKKKNPIEYNIFFIITSNNPNDTKETINTLIECSNLPLSIVIIGVGKNLELLNNLINNIKAMSNISIEKRRNLIKFISFDKIGFDEIKLSNIFLKEIAKQIVEYYSINNLTPDKIKINNTGNIKENNKIYNSFEYLKNSSISSNNSDINTKDIKESNNNNINNNNINIPKSVRNFILDPSSGNEGKEDNKKKYENTPYEGKMSVKASSNPYCLNESRKINYKNIYEDVKK